MIVNELVNKWLEDQERSRWIICVTWIRENYLTDSQTKLYIKEMHKRALRGGVLWGVIDVELCMEEPHALT